MCTRVRPWPEWNDWVHPLPPNCSLISRLFCQGTRSLLKKNWQKGWNSVLAVISIFSILVHSRGTITTYAGKFIVTVENHFVISVQHCWELLLFLMPETASYQYPCLYSLVMAPCSLCWTEICSSTDNLISQFPLQFDVTWLCPIEYEQKFKHNNLQLKKRRVDVCPFSFWLAAMEFWWPRETMREKLSMAGGKTKMRMDFWKS